MIDCDRYTNFILKNNLSTDQFLFLWLVFNRKFSLLYKYCEETRPFKKEDIYHLVQKGFIKRPIEATGKSLFADDFVVTDEFRKLLFTEDPEAMFDEFWNAYPNFLFINSKRVPTKGTNKEDLEERYVNLIENNLPLHTSIMGAVEWGRLNGYLNTGILKFFESEAWETLHEEMRETLEQGALPSQNEF